MLQTSCACVIHTVCVLVNNVHFQNVHECKKKYILITKCLVNKSKYDD